MDIETLAFHYARAREKKREIEAAMEAEMQPVKAVMELIEAKVSGFMLQSGTENAKTKFGTFYHATTLSTKTEDVARFHDFVLMNDARYLLTAHVNKDGVKTYMDENGGEPPPGIAVERILKTNFRKA